MNTHKIEKQESDSGKRSTNKAQEKPNKKINKPLMNNRMKYKEISLNVDEIKNLRKELLNKNFKITLKNATKTDEDLFQRQDDYIVVKDFHEQKENYDKENSKLLIKVVKVPQIESIGANSLSMIDDFPKNFTKNSSLKEKLEENSKIIILSLIGVDDDGNDKKFIKSSETFQSACDSDGNLENLPGIVESEVSIDDTHNRTENELYYTAVENFDVSDVGNDENLFVSNSGVFETIKKILIRVFPSQPESSLLTGTKAVNSNVTVGRTGLKRSHEPYPKDTTENQMDKVVNSPGYKKFCR